MNLHFLLLICSIQAAMVTQPDQSTPTQPNQGNPQKKKKGLFAKLPSLLGKINGNPAPNQATNGADEAQPNEAQGAQTSGVDGAQPKAFGIVGTIQGFAQKAGLPAGIVNFIPQIIEQLRGLTKRLGDIEGFIKGLKNSKSRLDPQNGEGNTKQEAKEKDEKDDDDDDSDNE